jgi:hypothetical protein
MLGTAFYSCTSKSNESVTDTVTPWTPLYDNLKKVDLPLELTKNRWQIDIAAFYKKLGRYSIPSNYPVGVVSEKKNFKTVLIIIDELPVIMTFDSKHKPIDTLFILDDYGMNPTKEIEEFAKIDADLRITLIDSIYTFKIDENERQLIETRIFTTTVDNYQVDKNGKIRKVD